MLKKQLYIQLLSNLIIPVLGFWWWNWSLYFILLFYLLDLISSELVQYLKIKKIKSFVQQDPERLVPPTKIYGFISLLFVVATIALIHLGMMLYQEGIDLKGELWNFVTYKEMGIPQGFILLPLIFMMAYSQFKMDFLMTQRFKVLEEKAIWKEHLKERFVIFTFSAITLFIAVAYQFKEWIVLVIILVCTTLYSYLQGLERIKQLS